MTTTEQFRNNAPIQNLEQALLPVTMRLPSLECDKRILRQRLGEVLGTGRPESVRFDLYADAAGKDNWDCPDQHPWYVVAVAATRSDDAWRMWKERFDSEYHGDFHMGNKGWYTAHGGEAARPQHLRRLFELRPWQFAQVLIAHRDAVRCTIDQMQPTPMDGKVGASLLWATQAAPFVVSLRETWRRLISAKAAQHLIRRVVFDQWAMTHIQAHGTSLMRFYGAVTPTFQSTPCPGLGITDGLAWGFRAALMYPNDRVLPWADTEPWDNRLQVSVLTTSPKPTTCSTMAQVRHLLTQVPAP